MSSNILDLNESGDEVTKTEHTHRTQARDQQTCKHSETSNGTNQQRQHQKGGFRIDDILFSVSNNSSFRIMVADDGSSSPPLPTLLPPSETSVCSSPSGGESPGSEVMRSPSLYLRQDELGSPPPHSTDTYTVLHDSEQHNKRQCYTLQHPSRPTFTEHDRLHSSEVIVTHIGFTPHSRVFHASAEIVSVFIIITKYIKYNLPMFASG